jgi:hypothetical protein
MVAVAQVEAEVARVEEALAQTQVEAEVAQG